MRSNAQTAAMLLLAAVAAVGCSKRDEPAPAQAGKPLDSAHAKPLATSGVSPAIAPKADEAIGGSAAPAIARPVTFATAEAAYHSRNYGEAVAMFEQYTTDRPTNAWGHFMLGLSAWKAGDLAKAETALDAALRIDPNHVKSLVNLSRVHIEQKRFDLAVEKLTHAGSIDPQSIEVQRLLGRAYYGKGQADEAVEAYRRAIALDDKDAWSMNNLGLLLLEERRAAEAVPLLTKAVELKKDVPAFHNNLGMALEHTGDFAGAAAAYKGALAADAGYAKAQQNLARVESVRAGRVPPKADPAAVSSNETAK
jgi:tetratricopeptide (TPR) repeat protein